MPSLYVPGQCLEVRHGHVAPVILVEVLVVGRLADGHRLRQRWRRRGGGEGGGGRELCDMAGGELFGLPGLYYLKLE